MTKYFHYFIQTCLATIILISYTACKKEKTSWDTRLKAPLAQTELKVADLIASDQVQTNTDSSLKIVFENELANIILSDVYQLPDETVEFGSSLQSLKLDDDSVLQSITLGELARAAGYDVSWAVALGIPISLPALTGLPDTEFPIDNSALFETIDVQTGKIEITITNDLPVDMLNVNIDLSNSPGTGGELLGTTTFPIIPTGQSRTNEIFLDGKTVSSQLVIKLYGYSTAASSSPALIDTTKSLDAKIVIKDIVPSAATAIWPEQNLIDTTSLAFLGQNNGAMIKEMVVKKGTIYVDAFSSLQDSMFISYSVPNLIKDGKSFTVEVGLPPAPVGGYSSKSVPFNFDGYDYKLNGYGIESTYGEDLNGDMSVGAPDTVNTYVQILAARMKYTGNMVPISLSDTVFFKVSVGDVVPYYVDGYMGKDTVEIGPSTETLTMFDSYLSGKLKIEDAKVSIVVENHIGAGAELQIESLSGTNSVNNSTVSLSGTGVSSKHNVGAATLTGSTPAYTAASSSVELTNSNSNAGDFLGNLPNSINYSLKTMLNGNLAVPSYLDVVNSTTPINFIYDSTGVSAKINVEVPLSMVAENLTLVDTMDFNYTGETDTKFSDQIFTLVVENGFGFDATVNLVLLNETGTEVGTLLSKGFVKRGEVDVSSGKTSKSTKSLINFVVQDDEIVALKASSKIKAIIQLHSYNINDSSQKFHKIYSSDSFKLKLIGAAVYNVNF